MRRPDLGAFARHIDAKRCGSGVQLALLPLASNGGSWDGYTLIFGLKTWPEARPTPLLSMLPTPTAAHFAAVRTRLVFDFSVAIGRDRDILCQNLLPAS